MRLKDYFIAGMLLLIGSLFIWHGLTPVEPTVSQKMAATPASFQSANQQPEVVEQSIETIRVGQRMVGRNPNREEVESWVPDASTWKKVDLHMEKPSGASLWITLIRPKNWLETRDTRVDGTIDLELPEMGASGPARVLSIGPCPKIQAGEGQPVVTGTFRHEVDDSNKVVSLHLAGQSEPTGVTDNHLCWSVDRREFVPAGQLRIGEKVSTVNGTTHVTSVEVREYSGYLYNLETTEHVYRVAALGTLVHNACPLRHGTDRVSAEDIVSNGLDRNRAEALGGNGDFFTTRDTNSANFFARANPAGGDPAIIRIDFDDNVLDSLRRQGLVDQDGDVFRFPPEAFDIINEFGEISLE